MNKNAKRHESDHYKCTGQHTTCRLIASLALVGTLAASAHATTLTADQVAQAAYGVGFRGGALVNSIAIADAESSFVLEAIHYNNDSSVDRGLWQINSSHSQYNPSLLLSSASYNASAAYDISRAATDATWTPWVTFNTGAFTTYLTVARNAAQNIDSTVIRAIGDRVSANISINVRATPGNASVMRTVSANTTGTVVDGWQVAVIGAGTYRFVWWKIHWDDGGSDGWSVEDYISRIAAPQPVAIRFETLPAGLQTTVDSTTYTTPVTFNWVPGSQHSLSVPTPQYSGLYTRYQFTGPQNQTIITPSSSQIYTAIFSTQYALTMVAASGGNVSSGGWYDSGSAVPISATPNSGFSFSGWTGSGPGSYSGNANPASVNMNGPIFETANFTPNPISITVQAPPGRSFTVDQTVYTASQTFSWVPGSSHTIATTSPQSGGPGVQYVWGNWSDAGAISHAVAPSVSTTYTANFATQYFLTMNAEAGGTVSPTSGWIDGGLTVPISASPVQGYSFTDWTGTGAGSYSGTSSSSSITMNGPVTETAGFATVSPPLLGVQRQGDKVLLSWPTSYAGYIVDYATNLPITGWTPDTSTPTIVGSAYWVTNTISGPMMLFRLRKP